MKVVDRCAAWSLKVGHSFSPLYGSARGGGYNPARVDVLRRSHAISILSQIGRRAAVLTRAEGVPHEKWENRPFSPRSDTAPRSMASARACGPRADGACLRLGGRRGASNLRPKWLTWPGPGSQWRCCDRPSPSELSRPTAAAEATHCCCCVIAGMDLNKRAMAYRPVADLGLPWSAIDSATGCVRSCARSHETSFPVGTSCSSCDRPLRAQLKPSWSLPWWA